MLFGQSTAPTGWTKKIDHDNKALRVVSGTAGSGGSVSFTGTFTNRSVSSTTVVGNVGDTTLSTNQMPVHSHQQTTSAYAGSTVKTLGTSSGRGDTNSQSYTANAGNNYSHTHSFSGFSHNHTLEMSVQYIDVIRAQKN